VELVVFDVCKRWETVRRVRVAANVSTHADGLVAGMATDDHSAELRDVVPRCANVSKVEGR
jgi:hypothetical protein